MPKQIRCEECGCALLSFVTTGPEPIDSESCPKCGGTEFHFVEA